VKSKEPQVEITLNLNTNSFTLYFYFTTEFKQKLFWRGYEGIGNMAMTCWIKVSQTDVAVESNSRGCDTLKLDVYFITLPSIYIPSEH
jgi:hypothetical protein